MLNYNIEVLYQNEKGKNKTYDLSKCSSPNGLFASYPRVCSYVSGGVKFDRPVLEFEETTDDYILKIMDLTIIKSDETFVTTTNLIETLTFNKATTATSGNFSKLLKKRCFEFDNVSLSEFLKFISNIMSVRPCVQDFFTKNKKSLYGRDCLSNYGSNNFLYNSTKLIFYNINELEKFINSGQQKLLKKNLGSPDFVFEDSKKLSQTIGLPPFAMPLIKKNRLEDSLPEIKDLASVINGNSLRICLEFITNSKYLLTLDETGGDAKSRATKLKKFFEDLNNVVSEGYKVQDVLNYVLKQSFMYSMKEFSFPFEELNVFADYVRICKQHSYKCAKYPQQLIKMHDVVVINSAALMDLSKEPLFEEAVSKYKKYENELKEDGYIFIVPKSIKALIDEGNDLHHCIGSYVDSIISGESRIFFMRESGNSNESFVTVELDEKLNIKEIKGIFNEDPDASIIKIANKWAGICKRIK